MLNPFDYSEQVLPQVHIGAVGKGYKDSYEDDDAEDDEDDIDDNAKASPETIAELGFDPIK